MSETAVSDVAIANLALVSLGADTIMSLDENSENARKINAIYSLVRDEVLRAYPWNFAIEWASLAQLSETPVNGYDYAYQLPSDPYCLKVIRLDDDNVTASYRVEGRKLYCNLTSVTIQYIKRVTDPTQFDSAFVTAFAARLAAELAYPITGSLQVRKEKMDEYLMKIREARALDGQEGKAEVINESDWLDARSGNSDI